MTVYRTPKLTVSFWLTFQESWAYGSYEKPRNGVYALCPSSEYESNRPMAVLPIALPLLGAPERVSENVNCPFWLLVHVGQAETLISSLSFLPDFSKYI